VVKIALEEYGYVVLLRLIDVTDDTVLIRKAIYGELMKKKEDLMQVLTHKFGRLLFLHLLAPRSSRYFPQETIKLLQPAFFPSADPTAAPVSTSKKESEVRRKEVLTGLLPDLLSYLLATNAPIRSLLTSQHGNFVLFETALSAPEDKKAVLLAAIGNETRGKEESLLNDFVASRFFKRLIKLAPGFGLIVAKEAEDHLLHWAQQKESAHVIAALLEDAEAGPAVKKALSKHLEDIKSGPQHPAKAHILKHF